MMKTLAWFVLMASIILLIGCLLTVLANKGLDIADLLLLSYVISSLTLAVYIIKQPKRE